MLSLTLGLRLTYDGFRGLLIKVSDGADKLIDEVYKDISALHLVPPPRRSVTKAQGEDNALDMFWDTTEDSTVYEQTRRCIENLDMDSADIVKRGILTARVFVLPANSCVISSSSRCIALAARSPDKQFSSAGLNNIMTMQGMNSPAPRPRADSTLPLSTNVAAQPPTAPRSMSQRSPGKIPQIKQEDTSDSNGSLVHRTLASRISSAQPYPSASTHHTPHVADRTTSGRFTRFSSSKERSLYPPPPQSDSSSSAKPSASAPSPGISILGASSTTQRDNNLGVKPSHINPERESLSDSRNDANHKGSERMVPEWRMFNERDSRRRAEAEAEELRRQVARLRREQEHHHGERELTASRQDDAALITAQQQLAEARMTIQALQDFQLRAEEARSLLVGQGDSALRGSGIDIVDIVRSVERQFKALGDELAKEHALRQVAEEAIRNISARNSASTGNGSGSSFNPSSFSFSNGASVDLAHGLANTALGSVGYGSALNSVLGGNGPGGAMAGNGLNILGSSLLGLAQGQGQDAQLLPGLINVLVELANKNGSQV